MNQIELMFFQDAIYDPSVSDFIGISIQKARIWDPFEIQLGPKLYPKSSNLRPKALKRSPEAPED